MFSKTFLLILAAVILCAYLVDQNVSEKFTLPGVSCYEGREGTFEKMCHSMAKDNCHIPTWTNQECWLRTYEKCMKNSKLNKVSDGACDCLEFASQKCTTGNWPAEQCYAKTKQKCLAGYGLAPDPDRA
jgi:hypothetical protein